MRGDIDVLIIGSGGREHALAWKLAQSPRLKTLYCTPGNPGTAAIGKNVPIAATDVKSLVQFAKEHRIDLTVVGPDDPLALGIVNQFQKHGLRIFGPRQEAVRIESSKAFAKTLMQRVGIPTAPFTIYRPHQYIFALRSLKEREFPLMIKAGGLALGKGAYPCFTLQEAKDALRDIVVERVHKDAGEEVIIEEYLEGQELSFHAFCDNTNAILAPVMQDHKYLFDGDRGLMTGGMGAFGPVPWANDPLIILIRNTIIVPALNELQRQKIPFTGCFYPGIVVTSDGPMALEYNARFGDPEAQVLVRLLNSDLLEILEACVENRLAKCLIEWRDGFAVCIVLASAGYPGNDYRKFVPIEGVAEAEKLADVIVFHAGTVYTDRLRTSGGRVLGITAWAPTLSQALERAYKAAEIIRFAGKYYRTDIGAKAFVMPPLVTQ